MGGFFDGDHGLDATFEVALHPVRGSDVVLGLAAVVEVENSCVLEEAADDADDAHLLGQPRDPRSQPAGIPDDQVHRDTRAGCLVEGPSGVGVLEGVELEDDSRLLAGVKVVDLTLDLLEQGGLQHHRRREELLVLAPRLVAGREVVEELGQILADLFVTGEEPNVRVEPGGTGVVVARSHMGVAAQTVEVLPDREDHLAVGLQADDAVGDVDSNFLHPARPADICALVEAGLQLEHHRNLLAVARRGDQVVDHPSLLGCAVEGHLDRANLRILARFLHEALDRRGEALIGMVNEDRTVLADRVEDVLVVDELGCVDRAMGLVEQMRNVEARDLHHGGHPQHPDHVGNVGVLVESELGAEHSAVQCAHAGPHLEPNDGRKLPLAQLELDRLE